jgi:hypothetical protein
MAMKAFGIDLQRISLGALVIALGLLVDDAIIAVEMMVVKMEQGWDRFKAATFAYTSTAFPMLTGTLITAAGFTPVGFARSGAGEYTISIFQVVTISRCWCPGSSPWYSRPGWATSCLIRSNCARSARSTAATSTIRVSIGACAPWSNGACAIAGW